MQLTERMLITCVMQQHARTYKLQLSGPSPTVYSLYCDPYLMLTNNHAQRIIPRKILLLPNSGIQSANTKLFSLHYIHHYYVTKQTLHH